MLLPAPFADQLVSPEAERHLPLAFPPRKVPLGGGGGSFVCFRFRIAKEPIPENK